MMRAYTPPIGDQENFLKIYANVIARGFFKLSKGFLKEESPFYCDLQDLFMLPFTHWFDRFWSRFRYQHDRTAFVAKG